MARSFEVTAKVDEMYELEVSIPLQAFDQREGPYKDHRKETHTFVCFNDACKWVRENPKAVVLSFVKMENKLSELKAHTIPEGDPK